MYLKLQFAVIASLLLGMIGFNYIVDPYGVYFPDTNYSFNGKKTEYFLKEPAIKPYRVSDVKPDTIILGMSAAVRGYDENHPYFTDKSFYNFGMSGATMYMSYRAFQHAMSEGNLKRVFLDLNILAFDEGNRNVVRSNYSQPFERMLNVNEDGSRKHAKFWRLTQIPQYLLSLHATGDSITTLRTQSSVTGWDLTSRGSLVGVALLPGQNQGERFREITASLIYSILNSHSPTHAFTIYRKDGSLSRAFMYYERLLDDAYRNDIEVTLVLSPSHMYFYEALDFLQMENVLAEWKREVLLINENLAKTYGKSPYPLWDFAYYSDVNVEVVPPKENNTMRMRWYSDPLHFLPSTGDHILDQIYLGSEGTGVRLTPDNIDAMLEIQREKKEQFHREHPGLKQRLKALFEQGATTNAVDA